VRPLRRIASLTVTIGVSGAGVAVQATSGNPDSEHHLAGGRAGSLTQRLNPDRPPWKPMSHKLGRAGAIVGTREAAAGFARFVGVQAAPGRHRAFGAGAGVPPAGSRVAAVSAVPSLVALDGGIDRSNGSHSNSRAFTALQLSIGLHRIAWSPSVFMIPPHVLENVSVARRFGLPCVALLAVSLLAIGCNGTPAQSTGSGGRGGRGGRGGGGAPQPVVTAKVSQKNVPVDIAAVGNVEAYTTVSVRSQVTGQLQRAFFQDGDVVKKGDRLFTIDPRPLEAALKQAEATLLRDQALLNQAEAQVARDEANADYQQLAAERQAQLVTRGLVSKDAGDQSRAAADATLATIKADKAAFESAKAQLAVQQSVIDNAKVLLSYTDIRATIDGRTGSNTVRPGNLVTANSTELVTISQLQPVYVTFAVPAVHLPTVKNHAGADQLMVMATTPEVGGQPIEGRLTFVDNAVDQTTDTIKLKATFPNHDLRLWPGQFTRVSLRLTTLMNATVIPSQAVQTGQNGQFVFVVTPDATVEQRPITVAQRMGEVVVVGKGVAAGETIVTEGQLRLEQGTRVQNSDGAGAAGVGASGGRRGRGGRGDRGRGSDGRGGTGRRGAQ